MRRLLYLAALSMLVVALTASVALGQSRGPSGADGSFNCEDFDTQEQAQAFFDADPSDPDGLDGPPGDAFTGQPGVACESLPAGMDDGTAVPVGEEDATVSCPAGEVSVLTDDGFICVPENVEDQTPAEIDAVVNDPRPNAETEIVENQGIPQPGDLTPAQAEASGNDFQPADDGVAATQYADDDMADNDDDMTALPDTGGFSLGGIAAGAGALLIAGGLLLKRRLT